MRKFLPFVLVAVVLAAGCSSDTKTSTSSSGSTASSSSDSAAAPPVSLPGKTNDKGTGDATSGTIELEADDFYFNPTFIKVTPGATVKVTFKNDGKAQHTFTSADLGVDQVVEPGKEVELNITVPATAPVEFHCRFHQSSGMQGALFDAASAASGAGSPTGSTSSSSSSSSSAGGVYN
ncbi:MAG: cupredoxin domain-containing protein [Acidimicrobiales bacterium]